MFSPVRFVFLLFCIGVAHAQAQAPNAKVSGKVLNETGKPLELVNVFVVETAQGTTTNAQGDFQLNVPGGKSYAIRFQYLGYQPIQRNIRPRPGEEIKLEIRLQPGALDIQSIEVQGEAERGGNMIKIDPRISRSLANPSGNFEMVLQGLEPGLNRN